MIAIVLPVVLLTGNSASTAPLNEGADLIGKVPPEFAGLNWVDSKPLTLKELRGKPVLIRFWNRHCSMCENSAPFLNELYEKYSACGLVIVGIHHKKTPEPDTVEQVRKQAREWKIAFPIAIDNDWATVKKIWMNRDRSMTSASILIGKDGRVAWLHSGGTLSKGKKEAIELEKAIGRQL